MAVPASRLLEVWARHLEAEFETKDVTATLATMVEDASVDHVPTRKGGRGKAELLPFYRDVFIPSWPDDLRVSATNRVVGDGQIVEETHLELTHSRRMDWFLPGIEPTGRRIVSDFVVVVQFRGDKLACERIYWDQAEVLRQIGLLPGA